MRTNVPFTGSISLLGYRRRRIRKHPRDYLHRIRHGHWPDWVYWTRFGPDVAHGHYCEECEVEP